MDIRITTEPQEIKINDHCFMFFREIFQGDTEKNSVVMLTDEEFNGITSFPADVTVEAITGYANGYVKGYDNGIRTGECRIQNQLKKLLNI